MIYPYSQLAHNYNELVEDVYNALADKLKNTSKEKPCGLAITIGKNLPPSQLPTVNLMYLDDNGRIWFHLDDEPGDRLLSEMTLEQALQILENFPENAIRYDDVSRDNEISRTRKGKD